MKPKMTTITPKFQVHIPVSVREEVGLKTHGRAFIRAKDSTIIIEPVAESFLSLGGAFKVKNPTPAEEIRRHIDYTGSKH